VANAEGADTVGVLDGEGADATSGGCAAQPNVIKQAASALTRDPIAANCTASACDYVSAARTIFPASDHAMGEYRLTCKVIGSLGR
jgi:CO/xanthine dehydrogenase FAD-binding subunit